MKSGFLFGQIEKAAGQQIKKVASVSAATEATFNRNIQGF